MIMQPEYVTGELFEEARNRVEKKEILPTLSSTSSQTFVQGQAAQIMPVGPTRKKVPRFIAQRGQEHSGEHHEIYPSDPNRPAPEKLKTASRQPFGRT